MNQTEASTGQENQAAKHLRRSRFFGIIKAVAPWLGAAAIFTYLFWEIPIADALRSLSRARLDLLVPGILIAVTYWFLLESFAYSYLFSRFNSPLTWAEARSLRGVTYIVTAINWNVGTAAVVLHLKRSKNIPALESASSLFFYTGFDALLLTAFAFIGASFFPESAAIRSIQLVSGIALTLQLITLTALISSKPAWSWLRRIRSFSLVQSFRLVQVRDVGVLLSIRLVYLFGFLMAFWIGAQAFGIQLPLALAMASVPPIMMAGALPLSPAGLGTQAAAMLFFWSDYGDKASIVAFGLVFPIALTVTRCLLGLLCVRDLRTLRQPHPDPNDSEA